MKTSSLPQPKMDSARSCDATLGNLLILLQPNYPAERETAEKIFEIIRSNKSFVFLNFSSYIVLPDFLEEFLYISIHHADTRLELTQSVASTATRRIGTRGSDKGVKADFKQLIRKQLNRSGEDMETLITQFITQEHMCLVQNIFDS